MRSDGVRQEIQAHSQERHVWSSASSECQWQQISGQVTFVAVSFRRSSYLCRDIRDFIEMVLTLRHGV